MDTETAFSHADIEIQQRDVVYKGFFSIEKIQLRHRLYAGGWSDVITRERFVRGTAVAAVIYDPQHHLIGLVEQFRIGLLDDPAGAWCREVVAGMVDGNQSNHEVVLRELQEEADIVPTQLHTICDYYVSPGGTSESLRLYCAIADLSKAGGIYGLPEEGEDIRMVVVPEDEVFTHLYDGQYNNAATLICIQWLMMNRPHLIGEKQIGEKQIGEKHK